MRRYILRFVFSLACDSSPYLLDTIPRSSSMG